jgi:hypothetical protein
MLVSDPAQNFLKLTGWQGGQGAQFLASLDACRLLFGGTSATLTSAFLRIIRPLIERHSTSTAEIAALNLIQMTAMYDIFKSVRYLALTSLQQTLQVRNHMERLGWVIGKDLFYYLDKGGQHNEYYWGRRFDQPMKDLYPITNSPTSPL